jgi:NDP-sugar pyrophosphorylase family protein
MKASEFFLRDVGLREKSMRDEPFLLHNVDVLSAIDLGAMVKFHCAQEALATLAVQHRKSARYLLFDGLGRLCGRRGAGDGAAEMAREAGQTEALAFTGIHVISLRVFSLLSEEREAQAFPIIPAYLRLAGAGEKIVGYRADDDYWRDVGTVENLEQAAEDVARKVIEL